MAQVITFENFTPVARYDGIPWTEVQIEESTGSDPDGTWTVIDTQTLSPVDADPALPAARSFTTELATEGAGLWYRLIFLDATGDDTLPTTPIQNVESEVAFPAASAYATVTELARILKVRDPSDAQTIAMERVLLMSSGEINSEIGLTNSDLSGWQLALAEEVTLERAVEHWRQQESPFGAIGLGTEFGPSFTSKDSWDRHANKLAPLKSSWGLA